MGDRGKSEEMKSRKTNLEPVQPDSDRSGTDNAMTRPAHKPEVRLGREAQARIGQQLRDMYQTFVHEGVPEHLTDLINRLSEQE